MAKSIILSVNFIDKNTGWIISSHVDELSVYSTILKTTNGGIDWINISRWENECLFSIQFLDQKTGWAVGTHGTVIKTSDGGITWQSQNNNSLGITLRSICFKGNIGWAVGESGTILKTINNMTSVEDNNQAIPNLFTLSQNYPNPFNPYTKIQYSVPTFCKVSLKIFDVLGREVEILIDEEKKPGVYTVEFNANKLASGVYFYQLRAPNFVSTKKLLLLK